jgi:hypothetical protein
VSPTAQIPAVQEPSKTHPPVQTAQQNVKLAKAQVFAPPVNQLSTSLPGPVSLLVQTDFMLLEEMQKSEECVSHASLDARFVTTKTHVWDALLASSSRQEELVSVLVLQESLKLPTAT